VNASGEITGTSMTANGRFRAFVSNGSGMTSLGSFAGSNGSSYGLAINNAGEVVGNAQTAQGFSNAFIWLGGSLIDIGTLGGTQSYAYGVNDSGTVVGYSLMSDNTTHAFVYSDGVMLDLNNLLPIGSGWTIEEAYGINNSGDILGEGTLDGQLYAVELTPSGDEGGADIVNGVPTSFGVLATPEPGTLFLGGIGAIAIALAARFRKTRRTA
jgi:probable HAF family extracellular repeat protein